MQTIRSVEKCRPLADEKSTPSRYSVVHGNASIRHPAANHCPVSAKMERDFLGGAVRLRGAWLGRFRSRVRAYRPDARRGVPTHAAGHRIFGLPTFEMGTGASRARV